MNYIAYAGGGEAQAAIMGGHVTAGISGLGEFAAADQVRQAARARDLVRQAHPRHRHPDAEGTGRCRRARQLARHLRRARHHGRAAQGADRRGRQGGQDCVVAGNAQAQRLDRPVPRGRRVQDVPRRRQRSGSTRSSRASASKK